LKLLQFEELDSTPVEAKRQMTAGLRQNCIICAMEQTNAYGRYGRRWTSSFGNLYWTAVLFPDASWPTDTGLTFASGLAVCDTLRTL
jgi:biotin-(acetyl-CoA carboxylase) ligase